MRRNLRIVFFCDIVGQPGRRAVAAALDEIKKDGIVDLIIGNVENVAHGKGVTEKTLSELTNLGFSVFTSGEHIYDKSAVLGVDVLFDKFPGFVKPANFAPEKHGRTEAVIETKVGKVLVFGLVGQ